MDTVDALAAESPPHERLHPLWGVRSWITTAAAWATLGATALLSAAFLVLDDATWWTECITVWPAYLWALALVPPTLLSVSRHHLRRTLIVWGALCVFGAATTDWRPVLRSGEPPLAARFAALRAGGASDEAIALRVVAWNVAGYRTEPPEVVRDLATLTPDLCLLQEADDFAVSELRVSWDAPHRISEGQFTAISRWPVRALPLSDPLFARHVQLLVLELPERRRVLVANVHLPIPSLVWHLFFDRSFHDFAGRHRLRVAMHRDFAAILAGAMAQEGADSLIIAGDFNVDGAHGVQRPLRALAEDVWPGAGRGWMGTFHTRLPLARLDQCWVSPGVTPVTSWVADLPSSDHCALVTDLILEP